MTNPLPPSGAGGVFDGVEVVELAEVDLDFALEQMFQQGSPRTLEATITELADAEEFAAVELFRDLGTDQLAALAARSQSIQAVPGYILLAPGRPNTKVFFVVEGQLRLYAPTNDGRPVALVDVGHSTGLHSALTKLPAEHAVIATEISDVLCVEISVLDELAKQHHEFARRYADLLASYVRGDNCLSLGARSPEGVARQGYVDELTLLHNQHWLTTMLPRLVARFHQVDKPLAVVTFAIDKFEQIARERGIGTGLRVLEMVSRWALDQTRPIDILAIDKSRYVFAFLPDCDLGTAHQQAERLKTSIHSKSVALGPDAASESIPITLSFGVAVLEQNMKAADLIEKAETLVKKAAMLGGNRVIDTL